MLVTFVYFTANLEFGVCKFWDKSIIFNMVLIFFSRPTHGKKHAWDWHKPHFNTRWFHRIFLKCMNIKDPSAQTPSAPSQNLFWVNSERKDSEQEKEGLVRKKTHGFIAQSCPYLKTSVKHIFETYTLEGTQISILKIGKITMNSLEYDLSESKFLEVKWV